MYQRTPSIPIGQQVAQMRRDFPQFAYRRNHGVPTWYGTLQPSEDSPQYHLKITYRHPKSPRVWVTAPLLRKNAPHRYPQDGSLCLYYPDDGSWTTNHYLSETIVPWAALWLGFYELWLLTGTWHGPEAPHGRRGKKAA